MKIPPGNQGVIQATICPKELLTNETAVVEYRPIGPCEGNSSGWYALRYISNLLGPWRENIDCL